MRNWSLNFIKKRFVFNNETIFQYDNIIFEK